MTGWQIAVYLVAETHKSDTSHFFLSVFLWCKFIFYYTGMFLFVTNSLLHTFPSVICFHLAAYLKVPISLPLFTSIYMPLWCSYKHAYRNNINIYFLIPMPLLKLWPLSSSNTSILLHSIAFLARISSFCSHLFCYPTGIKSQLSNSLDCLLLFINLTKQLQYISPSLWFSSRTLMLISRFNPYMYSIYSVHIQIIFLLITALNTTRKYFHITFHLRISKGFTNISQWNFSSLLCTISIWLIIYRVWVVQDNRVNSSSDWNKLQG